MEAQAGRRYGVVASVSVRNNERVLGPLLDFVGAFCGGVGLSESKQAQAVRSVREALAFRVEGAYADVGMVTLDIAINPTDLSFTVTDQGAPYLLAELEARLGPEPIADAYHTDIRPGTGQALTLAFAYDARDLDVEALRRTAYPEETLLDREVEIRPLRDSDEEVMAAIECIYAAYGYGYCREKFYNPDVFRHLIEGGDLHSYVAANKSGQVLAHALMFDEELMRGLPDLGALVTKPFCRGMHIAQDLTGRMLADARTMGYRGVRCEPVLFHPYTQKLCTAHGMVPTGILFHAVNPETCGAYRSGDERKEIALAQLAFEDERVHRVALPSEHEGFLRGIFEKLGMRVETLGEDCGAADGGCRPDDAAEAAGSVKASVNASLRTGTIVVHGDGWMGPGAVDAVLEDVRAAEVVDLYLEMGAPGALRAYRAFVDRGFFLAGLVAGAEDGDYLVLQHLMGRRLKVANMVLEPDYQRVFNYLRDFMTADQLE